MHSAMSAVIVISHQGNTRRNGSILGRTGRLVPKLQNDYNGSEENVLTIYEITNLLYIGHSFD